MKDAYCNTTDLRERLRETIDLSVKLLAQRDVPHLCHHDIVSRVTQSQKTNRTD